MTAVKIGARRLYMNTNHANYPSEVSRGAESVSKRLLEMTARQYEEMRQREARERAALESAVDVCLKTREKP